MARHLFAGLLGLVGLLVTGPIAATAAPPGTTLLVSRPSGLGAVPPVFDNSTFDPGAVSADGRYAVFASQADGFAPGVDPRVANVFLRDTVAGTTTLVSRSDGSGGAGANGDSTDPDVAVGPDGHVLVAFASTATNLVDHVSGSAPAAPDERVWLRDVTAATTTLISREDGIAGAPTSGSGPSIAATASAGPVVAYVSGGGSQPSVVLRTPGAGSTQPVSCPDRACPGTRAGQGEQPDLRYVAAGTPGKPCDPAHAPCLVVAFTSVDASITLDVRTAQQVVVAAAHAPTTAGGAPGPFDRFVVASKTTAVPTSGFADQGARAPSLVDDGSAVAFLSTATNLTPDTPASNPGLAYLSILQDANQLLILSRGSRDPATIADQRVTDVAVAGSIGTAVRVSAAFRTPATSLGQTDGRDHAYLRDVEAGTTTLVDHAAGSPGSAGRSTAGGVAISADGSVVLFVSRDDIFGDGAGRSFSRVHAARVAGPGAGRFALISRPSGTVPLAASSDEAVSGGVALGGGRVAFSSLSDALSSEDDDTVFNTFVRDLATGRTILVSRADGIAGAAADASSFAEGISADGRRVVFRSAAGNLVPGSPPGVFELYVRDLDAGTTTLVSRANGRDGTPSPTAAFGGAISADGTRVAFRTSAALDPAGADGHEHVYLRDLAAQTTTLVDRDDGRRGAVRPVGSTEEAISGDGRHVAWASTAPLAGAPDDGFLHVFVRDVVAGTTVLASRAAGVAGSSAAGDAHTPSLDADGGVVAFATSAQNLGTTFPRTQVVVRDLLAGTVAVASRADGPAGAIGAEASRPTLDADGSRVSFSARGLDTADVSPTPASFELFVRDLRAQTTVLASRANGAAGAPVPADVVSGAIDPGGDCVVFDGRTGDLGDGSTSPDFLSVHLRVLRRECPVQPPQTRIRRGPGATTADRTPTFAFASDDPGARFECHLERLAFAPCAATSTTPALADGRHVMTVRAIDPSGYRDPTPATRVFVVDTRPAVAGLRLAPGRFRVGGSGGGTTIRFRLVRAARVTLRIERAVRGHRVGSRCVAGRGATRCTAFVLRGSVMVRGRAGRNAVRFAGRLRGRPLAPGGYRLTATPAHGRPVRTTFTVLPPAR